MFPFAKGCYKEKSLHEANSSLQNRVSFLSKWPLVNWQLTLKAPIMTAANIFINIFSLFFRENKT